MELPENDQAASASLPVQQQFYQEAGTKMAEFMGCDGGEIEVGTSAAAANGGQMNLQAASVEQVFSEEFFQQSLIEELFQLPPTLPSSSSSSLPSVSAGSPADCSTSLLRTMATMSFATPSPRDQKVAPLLHPSPPHRVPFDRHGHIHFPNAEADDAAMVQAMLAVISASSSALPTPSTPPPGDHREQQWLRGGSKTAFRSYNAALAPRAPRRPPGMPGQRMIKMGISIPRRMHIIRCNRERTVGVAAQRGQEEEKAAAAPPAPSTSQLQHMISERRRREKLSEYFEALRGLLPPGSKKDKVTVLAKTLEYMNLLIAQISDLEAKNRSLREAQIHQRINGSSPSRTANEVQWLTGGSPERVQVQVSSGAGASSESRREVTVRVVARAEGDLSELVVRVIAPLKEMSRFTVVSVDARQTSSNSGIAQANLTLRATGDDRFDEASLKEAVAKAVEGLVTPPAAGRAVRT